MDTDAVLALLQNVAAQVVTPRFRSLAEHQIDEKNPGDLVTVADREAEELLTRALHAAYPGCVVIGEEAVSADATVLDAIEGAEHLFTVDPVDGTKNFVNGSKDHAVMVAEVRRGITTRSWIWQPEHELAYVAERGAGATRNGELLPRRERTAALPARELRGATSRWALRGESFGGLPPLVGSWVCCGVDYPMLAQGEVDFLLYAHKGGHPWDHAPGALLLEETGGRVVALADGRDYRVVAQAGGLVALGCVADADVVRESLADLPA